MSEPATAPLPFPARIPFAEQLGIELWAAAGGRAELRLAVRPGHLNSWQVAHGGVLMTMLDIVMSQAARSVLEVVPGTGTGVATVEMKTSFLRPAEAGLRAQGRVLHRTATMVFCEGDVVDAAGATCAHATGTYKVLRGLPAGRRVKLLQDKPGSAAAGDDS